MYYSYEEMVQMGPERIKSLFQDEGLCVVSDVFSPEEIADIRSRVEDLKKEDAFRDSHDGRFFSKQDLPRYPSLQPAFFSPRLAFLLKSVLGQNPLYYGYSNICLGATPPVMHRDNADRYNLCGPDWQDESYSVISAVIYLQDHAQHSEGLKVKAKSHRSRIYAWGQKLKAWPLIGPRLFKLFSRTVFVFQKVIWKNWVLGASNAASPVGSVILWNIKVLHSANALRLKGFPNLCLPPALEKICPRFLRRPKDKPRIGLFFEFALKDKHFDYYLLWRNKTLKNKQAWLETLQWPEDVQRQAREAGIDLLHAEEVSSTLWETFV